MGTVGSAGLTEAQAQCACGDSYTVRNAGVRVIANTITAASTVTFRLGGVNQSIVLSIHQSTTGVIEDTSKTVSLVSGNLIAWQLATGSMGTSMTRGALWIQLDFAGSAGASNWLSANKFTISQITSTTIFGIEGTLYFTSESLGQYPVESAGTGKNARIYITTGGTRAFTVTFRVNGLNTALQISVGIGTTGAVADTTHQVSFAPGDLINWAVDSGGIAPGAYTSGIECETTCRDHIVQNSTQGGYQTLEGSNVASATETDAQYTTRMSMMAHHMALYVNGGDLSGNSMALRKNAADALVISGTGSGLFQNRSDVATFVSGDVLNWGSPPAVPIVWTAAEFMTVLPSLLPAQRSSQQTLLARR